MIAVDTSILAFAVNRHDPRHARAAEALERLAGGASPWGLPWSAAHEFLRLVTHPHLVPHPLGAPEALGFVRALLASPQAVALGPTPRHAEVLAELVAGEPGPASARLEIAAVLREHGVRELLSADREMRRFGFLTVIDPVRGESWTPSTSPARRYRTLRPTKTGPTSARA